MLDGRVCAAILAPNLKFTLIGPQYEVIKLGVKELSSLPEGRFAKEIFLEKFHLDRNKFVGVPNDAMKYLYQFLVLNMSRNLIDRLSENSFDYFGSLQVSCQILAFS